MRFVLLGPANEHPVIASKALFRHLNNDGIDVLKFEPGKNEVALVCDKGNGCIQYTQNVQSIAGDKFVGTVKIINTPHAWKPEGVSVLQNSHTAAISESTKILLLTIDASLTSGQLV